MQLANDPNSFKDAEQADYVGLGVHCALGSAFCADAMAVKYHQTKPSHTAVPAVLLDEPGGYHCYLALFGSRYLTPQISGGQKNLKHHGYLVTDAKGNLVDLNGNEIQDFFTGGSGFPGYRDINASQSLASIPRIESAGHATRLPVIQGFRQTPPSRCLPACSRPAALNRARICACVVTSSAVVGSSASSRWADADPSAGPA